jgi:branched-chain amino acid transport system substrate-binding protein
MGSIGKILAAALWMGLAAQASAQAAGHRLQAAPPIKVGAVSALSGPAAFPEAAQAARAYFDAVNAAGGVRGRRIEFISLDEGAQPDTAARAAERLLADPEVVALVGSSAGMLDCPVNRDRYASAGIVALHGASAAVECFTSSHIVPMNNGPYTGLASAVLFARTQLHSARPCVAAFGPPSMMAGYRQSLDRLTARTGRPSPMLREVAEEVDPSPVLRDLAAHACDTIIFTGYGPAVLQWMSAAKSVGVAGVNWVFLTPAYTSALARALSDVSDPVYVMAEFEPWSSSSLPLTDWKRVMLRARLPVSSLSQGGYLAAQHFVKVLRTLNGPITRDAVTRALRAMPPVDHPMIGMPLSMGAASQHNPNRTAMPMKLTGGAWRIAGMQWIEVPRLVDEP